jgi:quercetin dioxygenase-like cupin family protein
MARFFARGDGTRLDLPGRVSREIVSGAVGAQTVSLREVTIEPERAGRTRGPHVHSFEEVIHVLSGAGITETSVGGFQLKAGDTLVVPAGEPHVTRNTGDAPLTLLCFFPIGDVAAGTEEFSDWVSAAERAP